MREMNRWRVYCGEDFSCSFSSCMEAFKFIYDLIEKDPMPTGLKAWGKELSYNLRDGEITVWEEGDPYEYTTKSNYGYSE